MFACTVSQDNDQAVLLLQGEGSIEHASQVRTALLAALARSKRLEIRAAPGTRIGLPIIQLFCAAHRSALRMGSTIRFARDAENLREDGVWRAGLCSAQADRDGAPAGCVWQRGA